MPVALVLGAVIGQTIATNRFFFLAKKDVFRPKNSFNSFKTQSQYRATLLCQRQKKVKVVKWG